MSAIRNKLYYGIKPLIPPPARHMVRKWLAMRQLKHVANVWPILPGSERPPDGWPGWPHGKKFAFILTHDVEGPGGIAKCRKLMDLEMKLGFRSSFNFIPEGDYRVDRQLRDELIRNGFETGIHDLHHDGRLYQNRHYFALKAGQINQHLRHWNAVGFRSGFMLHNLEWLHDLDIEYDASTFDTDPFEPQPDNLGTIFPFWVKGQEGRGYMELPYTLAQDSTLFLLLGETSPNIWIQKLDWIARNGGMALMNVHPDYLRFEGEPVKSRTYPMEFYESLLKHVAERYAGEYWHVLPKDLANWHKGTTGSGGTKRITRVSTRKAITVLEDKATPVRIPMPALARNGHPLRICMVAYSNYESDNRIIRYAEELAKRGDHVEILALKRTARQPTHETISGVHVSRVQSRPHKDEQNRLSYAVPLIKFWLLCSARICWRHLRKPYDLIHVHNMPDFLVFTAWLPRLLGAKVILDIHDIVPEFYASKFDIPSTSRGVDTLKTIERMAARFSNHVIISNHLWLDTFASRNRVANKCSVFINNVNAGIFWARPRSRTDGKFIILFPGGLQWHQGLDIAVRAFQKITGQVPEAEFHIYGDGNMKRSLIDLTAELRLQDKVRFFEPLPIRQIADVMANADLGVVPKRADSFGNEAYSTKIMEFMSLGVPVIISETKIDRYYFNDSVVRFFPSGDSDALAAAMLEMICDKKRRGDMAARATDYARDNSWETRKHDYLQLVDTLCARAS